jgi:hypothetical protein
MAQGLLMAFIIIVIHYIADFAFQTEEMATKKSKELGWLIIHTMVYTGVWFFGTLFLFSVDCNYGMFGKCIETGKAFKFIGVTFVAHTLTDYFTSRWTSRLFADKIYYTGIPNFGAFSVIGIDQVLHYAQLFLTYYYLAS